MEETVYVFIQALLDVNRLKAGRILAEASGKCHNPFDLLENVVVPALEHIGREWEQGNVSLSQIYMSGRICEELTDHWLKPDATEDKETPAAIAISVLCDHHVMGKRIVLSYLRARGIRVIDYGHGLSVDELVEKVLADRISILLVSVLMLPSALKVRQLIEKLAAQNAGVKVIVGGAPFRMDEQLWKTVGAHATGKSAGDALKLVKRMATA
jgi:trimethylamine corrinoid protein